jgi:endonuclease YncB( thermonuclease family)
MKNLLSRLPGLVLACCCAWSWASSSNALAVQSAPQPAPAAKVQFCFTGLVVGISDGDTISVMHAGRPEKVRLSDIDCPESRQPYGQRAKQFTAKAAFNKNVTVRVCGKDKYGRSLGEVFLPNHASLNTDLLKSGLAWVYLNRSSDTAKHKAQSRAQLTRRGLWQDKEPIPPWQWRKLAKQKQLP